MSKDVVYQGALNGRFYSLAPVPQPGRSFVSSALSMAWTPGSGRGLTVSRTFCRGQLPFDGDLNEDSTSLAYDDSGSGVWRLWLREETRSVGRNAVEERAVQLAHGEDPDTLLYRMQKGDRVAYLEKARQELLQEALPQIRIVPLVVVSGRLWIGRRAAVEDRTYVHQLRQVFGDLEPDPLLWNETESDWVSCSGATLSAFVSSRSGELAGDVVLTEVDIRGRSIQVKAADNADEVRALMKAVTQTVSETVVRRMCFEVYRDGSPICVHCDAHGLYRGMPVRSVGGLPHERIRRRFDDVLYAAGRIRSVMTDLVQKASEQEES